MHIHHLICLVHLWMPILPARADALPTSGPFPRQRVGSPDTAPWLLPVDRLARPHGVRNKHWRDVFRVNGSGSGLMPRSGDYLVVDYTPHSEGGTLRAGVQVWIDRRDGFRFVVPKAAIRAADARALQAGHDLTQQTRTVEMDQEHFFVVYRWNPPDRLIHHEHEAVVGGGVFTVVVSRKSLRTVGEILYQE